MGSRRRRSQASAPPLVDALLVAVRGAAFAGPFLHGIVCPRGVVRLGEGDSDDGNQQFTARDDSCVLLAERIAVGLALHLHHVESATKSSQKSRTVRHHGGETSQLFELAADIDIDARLREAVRDACLAGSRPQGWKVAKRFVVRGHWRMQACGPGLSDRKLIFVAPYWKGPDDASVLVRAHTDEPE